MYRRIFALAGLTGLLIAATGREPLGDPTRPAVAPRSPSRTMRVDHGLTLDSVMVSDERRVAVINGRRVRIGDAAFGGRVVGIDLSGVRLRRRGKEIWVTLSPTGFKKPARTRRSSE